MIPIISSAYGVNLERRMLDNILYVVGKSDMPLLMDRYNDRLFMTHYKNVLTLSRSYKAAAYFCSHLYVEYMLLQITE